MNLAKKSAVCMAVLGLLALGGQAFAVIGTADDVPAATLLLPYFEVDLNNPLALTTLFAIGNASAAPAIAHVTLWTDLSVPTLDFNVYLTGYDIVTFNLRDLFTTGFVPATEHVNDADAISPVGIFSLVTNPESGVGPTSTSCNLQLPPPALPASLLNHIRNAHTGQASNIFVNQQGTPLCSGIDHEDNIARGYITIDNVNSCTLVFPGAEGYFVQGGGGTGANNINQLFGDYFYVDSAGDFAQAETLVHIEADDTLTAPNYTFYRKLATTGADNREALSSTFAARYRAGAFAPNVPGGTDLIVWRDSKVVIEPFSCALPFPTPFPLAQNQIVIFDEDENPDVPVQPPFSPPPPGEFLLPFPWEAQRVTVGGSALPVPFEAGWLYLNLNSLVSGQEFTPTPNADAMQNWVTDIWSANFRFSVGFDAIQLDNVTFGGSDVILPICDGDPDPAACD